MTKKAITKKEEYYKLPIEVVRKFFKKENPFIRVVSWDNETYKVYSVQSEDSDFVPFKKKSYYSEHYLCELSSDELKRILDISLRLELSRKKLEERNKKKKLNYYQSLPEKVDEFTINRNNGEVYDRYGNYICTIPIGLDKNKLLDYIEERLF